MKIHWKIRGRIFGVAILAMSFINANAGYSIGPAEAGSGDGVIEYRDTDRDMNAAQAQARIHLPAFLEAVMHEDGMARDDAGVKVAVPIENGGHEVIWVSPFGQKDGKFIGRLANEPNQMPGYHVGDVITFDSTQVRDWFFTGSDGKMYGSFTTRVMLKHMRPAAAAQISQVLSANAIPANW